MDHAINDGLAVWLGPALDELTDEQAQQVAAASRDIDRRYPEPDDSDLREAALSAAVQYLLGDTGADEFARALAQARRAESLALAAAAQVAVMLAPAVGEIDAAKSCGITRRTLRRAMGKDE